MKSFFSKKIVVGSIGCGNCMRIGYNGCKSTGICCAGRYCQFLCLAGNVPGVGGAAFQPTLGFGFDNFSVTAWGSTNFSGGNKELDLTLAYKFG